MYFINIYLRNWKKSSKTNFKGSKGAKIDPEKIRNRDMRNCIFSDVEFIGSFEGSNIEGADFTGSNYEAPVLEENEFRGSAHFCVRRSAAKWMFPGDWGWATTSVFVRKLLV